MEHESDSDNNNPEKLLTGLEDLKIRGQVETIETLSKSAQLLRRDLETWGGLLSLKPQWKTIS